MPANSRLGQIVKWLRECPRGGLIVLDECHKAKNLLPAGGMQPTQTARAVVELQEQLPNAKVLYSSATGERWAMLDPPYCAHVVYAPLPAACWAC